MKPHCVIALAALAMLGACTTVFHSATQDVRIEPVFASGVEQMPVRVEIDSPTGVYHVRIPAAFNVEPDLWRTVVVKVEEPCYQPERSQLNRSITPLYWADAAGLPIGVGIFAFVGDTFSGTLWKYGQSVKVPVRQVADYASCSKREESKAASTQMPGY